METYITFQSNEPLVTHATMMPPHMGIPPSIEHEYRYMFVPLSSLHDDHWGPWSIHNLLQYSKAIHIVTPNCSADLPVDHLSKNELIHLLKLIDRYGEELILEEFINSGSVFSVMVKSLTEKGRV